MILIRSDALRVAVGAAGPGSGRAIAWDAAHGWAAESAQADFVTFQPRFQPPREGQRIHLRPSPSSTNNKRPAERPAGRFVILIAEKPYRSCASCWKASARWV
jgi:hypothetical protein